MNHFSKYFVAIARARSRVKGISLAEILTVIAVFLIVILIASPAITQYLSNLDLNNSTKYLISNLKLAQQYTVTQQIKHAIRMEIYAGNYYLIKKEPMEEILQTFNLEENVIFTSFTGIADNEAVFNPTGAFDLPGEVIITQQTTAKQNKVYLKPSGYVTWEKLNP